MRFLPIIKQKLAVHQEETESITANLERYCPHKPFPKQQLFLDLRCKEAFYGGAAGPGKTDALLMAALQYVHVPKYSALILRRDFPRLSLPNSIMDRAKQWLLHVDGIQWNSQDKIFRFPSGSTIQFGYIDHPDDRYRYASSEYQFLGFDELTEFRLGSDEANPYLFMFSRLRRTKDNPAPLRIRSASNPGNLGHYWVRSRFIPDKALEAKNNAELKVYYADEENQDRAFVPATLPDNPAIDADDYSSGLGHLPPVTRERLLNGDWTVSEGTIINPSWMRYFIQKGELVLPLMPDKLTTVNQFHRDKMSRFAVIDTAGTSEDKAKESKGKPPSYSVCGVFDYHADSDFLFLRHIWRKRVGWDELKEQTRRVLQDWFVPRTIIENKHFGPALKHELSAFSQVELYSDTARRNLSVNAKVERSVSFQNRLEMGAYFVPLYENVWKPVYEGELFRWSGLAEETDDQIDVSSMACNIVKRDTVEWGGATFERSYIDPYDTDREQQIRW